MPIKAQLEKDLKDALRQRDAPRLSTIRLLLSAIHYAEIEAQKELDDSGVVQVLSKQAQQRRDSIESFSKGGRQDLVDKETYELGLIMSYLPQQLSREEIASAVREAIQQVGARGPEDMGKVMSAVMPKVRGRAEGREVNAVASELLRNIES